MKVLILSYVWEKRVSSGGEDNIEKPSMIKANKFVYE